MNQKHFSSSSNVVKLYFGNIQKNFFWRIALLLMMSMFLDGGFYDIFKKKVNISKTESALFSFGHFQRAKKII